MKCTSSYLKTLCSFCHLVPPCSLWTLKHDKFGKNRKFKIVTQSSPYALSKSLDEESGPVVLAILYFQKLGKIQTKNKMAVIVVLFSVNIFQSIGCSMTTIKAAMHTFLTPLLCRQKKTASIVTVLHCAPQYSDHVCETTNLLTSFRRHDAIQNCNECTIRTCKCATLGSY